MATMDANTVSGYEGMKIQAQAMIETGQIPFLCMHFDKASKRVYLMADSESLEKVRESSALIEIENILKSTFEESKKLTLYDQKFEAERAWYFSCRQGRAGLSDHKCHAPKPKFQFSWELDHLGCFEDRTPINVSYDRLPKEILRSIFGYLEPSDLKNVILVSNHWKYVADEPALWTGFGLPDKCRRRENNFVKFFQGSLSSKLQYLSLHNFGFQLNDVHFQNLLNLNLKTVTIDSIDLFNVSDDYLAQLVNNCRECTINEYDVKLKSLNGNNINVLGLNKLKAIFRKMENGTKLRSLTLSCVADDKFLDLSFVPSSTLANAFNRLEYLALDQVKLRANQLKAIFDYMSVKTKVKYLDIQNFDFDFIDMEVFDPAFNNLAGLTFGCGSNLNEIKVRHFVETLDKSCKLKTLTLSSLDVRDVPPILLARVINKVENVELESLSVTVDQLEQIFQYIIDGVSVIKCLHLNEIDTRGENELNSVTLAMAVNKLESFEFGGSGGFGDFSENETKEMFKVMSQGTNLKEFGTPSTLVSLGWINHIKEVDPETLARAIHNLETVRLEFEDSKLTISQYIAIFKRFGIKTNLKMVWSQGKAFNL